jgi:predicted phosphodiesterase
MRIAVIADIHGNLPALEAVLADIRRRDIDRTMNLGDCVSGPLWPREVCDLLMDRDDLIIRGNHDRWVSGPDPTRDGCIGSVCLFATQVGSLRMARSPTNFR